MSKKKTKPKREVVVSDIVAMVKNAAQSSDDSTMLGRIMRYVDSAAGIDPKLRPQLEMRVGMIRLMERQADTSPATLDWLKLNYFNLGAIAYKLGAYDAAVAHESRTKGLTTMQTNNDVRANANHKAARKALRQYHVDHPRVKITPARQAVAIDIGKSYDTVRTATLDFRWNA